MSFPIVIRDEADLDATDAYNYYELQLEGLGERFRNELMKAYEAISQYPQHYSFISSFSSMRDITMKRFPYTIIFEFNEGTVIVYAIHHDKKRPRHI